MYADVAHVAGFECVYHYGSSPESDISTAVVTSSTGNFLSHQSARVFCTNPPDIVGKTIQSAQSYPMGITVVHVSLRSRASQSQSSLSEIDVFLVNCQYLSDCRNCKVYEGFCAWSAKTSACSSRRGMYREKGKWLYRP